VRAVVFTGAGGNEVVRVEERSDPTSSGEDVVVRARFAALNPADLVQRAGSYPAPPGSPPDVPGLEVTGVVETCGERVSAWQPGDRVFGLVGGGGLADRVLVHERCLAPVPERLGDREAAAVPEAFITAHDAVRSQAGLTPGETLLVHGAAGGVGSAAVQIGLVTGARVLGVVRSDDAAEAVAELGAKPLRDADFVRAVQDATEGRGADVVLELVGAPHFPADLEALAPCGRIVVVGVGAGQEATIPLRRLMQKRATVRGTVLRPRPLEEKAAAVRAFEREVLPALGDGRMRPLVDSVYPAENVTDAFDRLAASGKVGKVLIEFS
jgi:putative PIG3 family NAD(P)H quinone oxidoreductase